MSKIEQIQNFDGLNTDADGRDMPKGDYSDALNIGVSQLKGGHGGVVVNRKGNIYTDLNPPYGLCITTGTYEDKKGSAEYHFVYSHESYHQIRRYNIDKTEETIFKTSLLNWDRTPITGISKEDGLLFWTDQNGLHKINTDKANENNKQLIVNVYFGASSNQAWADGNIFTFYLNLYSLPIDPNPAVLIYTWSGTILTTSGLSSLTSLCVAWANAFNANVNVNPYATAVSFGTYVQLTFGLLTDPTYGVIPPSGIHVNATSTSVCAPIYQNIYAPPIVTDYFDLLKYPPQIPLTFSYGSDPTRTVNYVNQATFQFAFSYVYDDWEESVLSPFSKLAFPLDPQKNYIEINFHNDRLSSTINSIIRQVNLYVRLGNTGQWQLMKTLQQFEYITGTYRFYNDENYTAIDAAYAVKEFDSIPITSEALETIKNRLFAGNNKEGYDNPPVDGSITVDFEQDVKQATWDVVIRARIGNTTYASHGSRAATNNQTKYFTNQPIWKQSNDAGIGAVYGGLGYGDNVSVLGVQVGADQFEEQLSGKCDQRIPLGGFLFYLVGTDYNAITNQFDAMNPQWDSLTWNASNGGTGSAGNVNAANPSSPLVYDGTSAGHPGSPNGNADYLDSRNAARMAIRAMMGSANTNNGKGIYHTAVIKGVKPGHYIARCASPWVSKGDILGKGSMYDYNNRIEWQNTSCPISAFANGVYEIEFTLDESGGIYDLNANNGGGYVVIEDLTFPEQYVNAGLHLRRYTYGWHGYLIDSGGTLSLLNQGNRMENQKVQTIGSPGNVLGSFADVTFPNMFTDHNGFYYQTIYNNDTAFNDTGYCIMNVKIGDVSAGVHIIKDYTQSAFQQQGLIDVQNGLGSSSANYTPPSGDEGNIYEVIEANQNSYFSLNANSAITGTVTDTNGTPIANMLVATFFTGRWALTSTDGSFEIITYANQNPALAATTFIPNRVVYFNACNIPAKITGGISIVRAFYLTIIEGGLFSSTNLFSIGQNQFTIVTIGVSDEKRGGIYQWALIYYDLGLRWAFAQTLASWKKYIAFFTEDLGVVYPAQFTTGTFKHGKPVVTWNITSIPPDWAYYYGWARTKIGNYSFLLAWAADSIHYVSINTDGTLTVASFGSALWVQIGLDNFITYQNTENNTPYGYDPVKNVLIGYVFQDGDRLRYITDDSGTYFQGLFDVAIKGMYGLSIVVENLADLPLLKAGCTFEIYRPKLGTEQNIFYEIADIYPVTNPTLPNRSHSVTTANFNSGDTYLISRLLSYNTLGTPSQNTFILESFSVSDFFVSNSSDIGRPTIADPTARQQTLLEGVRFSNKYFSGTQINGFSSWEGLNSDYLQADNGKIQVFRRSEIGTSEVLFIVMESNCMSLYIDEAQFKDANGQFVVAVSDSVIGSKSVHKGGYGTSYPESVQEKGGRIVFYCNQKGCFVRFSLDGNIPISGGVEHPNYKAQNYFKTLADTFNSDTTNKFVFVGFDQENDEINVTSYVETIVYAFNPVNQVYYYDTFTRIGSTIAFSEVKDRWVTKYSYLPDIYSRISNLFLSWYQGLTYRHNANPSEVPYCNFYGIQYPSQITIIFNEDVPNIKRWKVLNYVSTSLWVATSIATMPDQQHPSGQLSRLATVHNWSLKEGVYWADIKRDINSTGGLIDGDEMRSDTLIVTLQNNDIVQVILSTVQARALISNRKV